jgi:hypothetical protein
MHKVYKVLVFGASYGSLLAIKLVQAGHSVKLVCLPAEAKLFNEEGAIVRMPIKDRAELVEINSKSLPGMLSASTPSEVDPIEYDLVALAMQEPQYGAPGVRELLCKVAEAKIPCMSIMNMPPLAYLNRVPGIDGNACRDCYTDAGVWDQFDVKSITACSPDPQVFRPSSERLNVLQVRLPTNFKVANFDSPAHAAILHQLEADIDAVRIDDGTGTTQVPVKLKVHDSVFVPMAKWSMLIAGNYRCVQHDGSLRSIGDAVHADIGASRAIYEWVVKLCKAVGALETDLVPFEKYAKAALSLTSPSSAARALATGSRFIERVDRLVQTIAAQQGMQCSAVDDVVRLVDAQLVVNRTR